VLGEALRPIVRVDVNAGFVHHSCITDYAAAKSMQSSDIIEVIKPWIACPSCHHDIASEHVNISLVY
jgi:hypothetical protein